MLRISQLKIQVGHTEEELKKKVKGEYRIKENSKFYKVVKKTD